METFSERFVVSIYLIFEPGKDWICSHDDGNDDKHFLL